MDDTYPDPPEHLSQRAAELWCAIVGNRAKSPERIALLRAGLEAMNRADQASEILARDGLLTGSSDAKMTHVHPAVRIEKDARAEFRRIWGQLSLDWNYQVDGR